MAGLIGDAFSFVVSALLVWFVRSPAETRPATELTRRSLRSEIGEGLRWLWSHRLLRTLAIMVGVLNLGATAGQAILVLLARQQFGLGPVGFGLLSLGGAAGSLAGSLVAARIARRVKPGALLFSTALAMGTGTLLVGVAPNAWVAGVAFAVGSFGSLLWNVLTVSLRQAVIPDQLLGRVNGVYRLLGLGTMPLGAALGGALATAFGLRAAYVLPGIAMLTLPFMCAPVVTTAAVDAARGSAGDPSDTASSSDATG